MRKRGASAGFSMRHDLLRRSSLLDDVDAAPSFVLSLSYFAVFFGESLWRTTFANYVIQDLGMGAERLPFFFALAALPGTFAFAIGVASIWARVHLLAAFSTLMLGAALVGISMAQSTLTLAVSVLAIGIGFHTFYVISNSLCLLHAEHTQATIALGRIKSVGPMAKLLAVLLVFALVSSQRLPIFLAVVGVAVGAMGFTMAGWARRQGFGLLKGRLKLTRRLWPYYALNFLAGSRSAVFTGIVMVVIIDRYDVQLKGIAALLIAAHVATLIGYRLIGRFALRFNPRSLLAALYAIVALVFVSFAIVTGTDLFSPQQQKVIVQVLFLVDSLVFGVSVVTDGYLKSWVPVSQLVGTVAVGSSLFHGAKVIVPTLGGLLWVSVGLNAVFALGSVLAILAILACRKLP